MKFETYFLYISVLTAVCLTFVYPASAAYTTRLCNETKNSSLRVSEEYSGLGCGGEQPPFVLAPGHSRDLEAWFCPITTLKIDDPATQEQLLIGDSLFPSNKTTVYLSTEDGKLAVKLENGIQECGNQNKR